MSILNEAEIVFLQNLKKTYDRLGFNKSLHRETPIPDFVSADEFAALTEGFIGGKLTLDLVKGQIIVFDENGLARIIIGNFDE